CGHGYAVYRAGDLQIRHKCVSHTMEAEPGCFALCRSARTFGLMSLRSGVNQTTRGHEDMKLVRERTSTALGQIAFSLLWPKVIFRLRRPNSFECFNHALHDWHRYWSARLAPFNAD